MSENLSCADHFGQLILERQPGDSGPANLIIKRADPRILIARELTHLILRGAGWNGVKIYTRCACRVGHVGLCLLHLGDAKLEIHTRNRKLIYRFMEYDPASDAYVVQWPD